MRRAARRRPRTDDRRPPHLRTRSRSRSADGTACEVDHGHVVIAAITSCTNTSNPAVMIAAGLLAKNAVERGLTVKPWVKTSLAPGSRVVMDYYERCRAACPTWRRSGFNLVGFGCTTCIGNSGPDRPRPLGRRRRDLALVSVLSGNRNFEGRINPDVRMNYLISPPLVVAYALAGHDGHRPHHRTARHRAGRGAGAPRRHLAVARGGASRRSATPSAPTCSPTPTARCSTGTTGGTASTCRRAPLQWDDTSTYVHRPPFFDGMRPDPAPLADIVGARCLAKLGDRRSPPTTSPRRVDRAGHARRAGGSSTTGSAPQDFNSYGSRRGNHEVMIRGTFANIRLRNQLAPGTEGGWTRHLPSGEQMTIHDAAIRYAADAVPLLVLAGTEYGSGSSRDWAAKGTHAPRRPRRAGRELRAHPPLQPHRHGRASPAVRRRGQPPTRSASPGTETYSITGLAGHRARRADAHRSHRPRRRRPTARAVEFTAKVRIDTPKEADYYRHGGILQYVLRQLAR